MTDVRRSTVALLAGALALGLAGCGGGSSKPKTTATTAQTTVATTTPTDTTTTTKKSRKKKKPKTSTTSTASSALPLSQTPAKTLNYSGMGVKELGTVRLPKDSTIHWTNDGQLFQIIPASVKTQSPVNSMGHSGTAQIKKGAYHGFLVNAVGHWTVSIVPN